MAQVAKHCAYQAWGPLPGKKKDYDEENKNKQKIMCKVRAEYEDFRRTKSA
jgi:hypothetical protein